jgi:hypothetical protein
MKWKCAGIEMDAIPGFDVAQFGAQIRVDEEGDVVPCTDFCQSRDSILNLAGRGRFFAILYGRDSAAEGQSDKGNESIRVAPYIIRDQVKPGNFMDVPHE